MVGRKELTNAIALNSAMFNSARIVGPALAGVTLAAVGAAVVFRAERRQLPGRDRGTVPDGCEAIRRRRCRPIRHSGKCGRASATSGTSRLCGR